MSYKVNVLHSHSGLEREHKELAKDKKHVLIDEKYVDMFPQNQVVKFKHKKNIYYKVPIDLFVKKGGIFKNVSE